MRINNNMMAMNTHRQLGAANAGGAKSMEKLSSGMRINRAGDDAAGLSISEKMRGQIRGLTQASANSQDGISMIQTAEGALNETHAILQRMRELAVQSATDTNTNDDRAKIQGEVDQLAKEITRISNDTEFNTQNLLAGGLNNTFHVGANKGQNVSLNIGGMDAKSLGVSGDINNYGIAAGTGVASVTNVGDDVVAGDQIVVEAGTTATAHGDVAAAVVKSDAVNGALTASAGSYSGSKDVTITIRIDGVGTAGTGDVNAVSYSTDGGESFKKATVTSGSFTVEGLTLGIANADNENKAGGTYTFAVKAATMNVQLKDSGGNAIGDVAEVRNDATSVAIGSGERILQANFKFADLTANSGAISKSTTESTAAGFGADGSVATKAIAQKGINVSTQGKANTAIETINNALESVSAERSKLGAMQNRLEHTIKNLDTSAENLQASEARIRDVDMAKEMMEQTKQNILAQASTAMLAQANQAPQSVLQLLG